MEPLNMTEVSEGRSIASEATLEALLMALLETNPEIARALTVKLDLQDMKAQQVLDGDVLDGYRERMGMLRHAMGLRSSKL